MKKLICAALLLFTAAAVFAADPVEGYWVSINEESSLDGRASCRERV